MTDEIFGAAMAGIIDAMATRIGDNTAPLLLLDIATEIEIIAKDADGPVRDALQATVTCLRKAWPRVETR